jgi:dihydroorotate dehydrogenase
LTLLQTFHGLADYLVLNLSSPNTPGLRRLQDRPILTRLLELLGNEREKLNAASRRRVPVLVKLSPDLEMGPLRAAVEAIVEAGVEGVVASNTTLERESLHSPQGGEAGGLSGRPLRARSTELVRRIRSIASGLPIIASGGVADGSSAQEKLDAGASLVQVFTALIYEGPGLVPQILRQLAAEPGEKWSSPRMGAASL